MCFGLAGTLIEIGTVEIDQSDFDLPQSSIRTEIGCLRGKRPSFR
jgi:hypothetical protein